MATEISLRFLGVRAFHSAPGRGNQTTGGNTGCVEIYDGHQRILINAGFGINIAGIELFRAFVAKKIPTKCSILFSDFFWDSTMGLPFFTPIHFGSTEIAIFSGTTETEAQKGLDDVASNLFSPFNGVAGFRSNLSISQISKPKKLESWLISALALPHPLTPYPVTVWRLTHDHGADIGVVMICNTDPKIIAQTSAFLSGCKTLICAATTSPSKDGWDQYRTGFEDALQLAQSTSAEELLLTQYHPAMTDVMLQAELRSLRDLHKKSRDQRHDEHDTLKIHLASEIETLAPATGQQRQKAG